MQFFNFTAFEQFAAEAVEHYATSAPTVSRYIDELYVRISQDEPVALVEIVAMQRIVEEGQYMHPNYAANHVYKLMSALGMDTTGHAGF